MFSIDYNKHTNTKKKKTNDYISEDTEHGETDDGIAEDTENEGTNNDDAGNKIHYFTFSMIFCI